MKLASIGAGSLYTPDFALMLLEMRDKLQVDDWYLMDIDRNRLEVVAGYTKMVLDEGGAKTHIHLTTDLSEAVRDANYVIATIRVGKAHGRVLDESIPRKYGFIGQETTPPGGLAMGLRNIPAIVEIAQKTVELARPGAWLINLSNPAGMLTEAIYRYTKCKAVGLCNWPRSFWTHIAEAYEVQRDDVFLQLVGLNHLNWARAYIKGEYVGKDATRKFAENMTKKYGAEIVAKKFTFPQDIVDIVEWPLIVQYNHYYYMMDEALADQKEPTDTRSQMMLENLKSSLPKEVLNKIDLTNVKLRAEFVELIEKITIELYRQKSRDGIKLIAGSRGGEGYGAAALEVILAMENNSNQVQAVDFPNLGSIPGLPDDIVVEHSCLVNAAGIFPISMPALTPHMHALVNSVKQYEILACEAAMEGNYRKALEALIANPLINDLPRASLVLNDLLTSHKANLPNFSEAIERIERGERPY
ncbi:MAG: hypothetical protein GYA15_07110 [Leptolinea sp.]|jgi:6-phospho-beta-glucosidase|nr:hypothetical protein [Leptolinea sp.]